jgi:3-oxoacyl-[acyl-carrier-protein] synthase III
MTCSLPLEVPLKAFTINRHNKLVLPGNFFPKIDFSGLDTLEQLAAVVKRDFEEKAPTGADLLERIAARTYPDRYALLRDFALHLFWVNRFSMTMYEQRPMAWRYVPKKRTDVFMPMITPWKDAQRKAAAVWDEYARLPSAWSEEVEYRIFTPLFDIFSNRRHHATELPAINPSVREMLDEPTNLAFHIAVYDPDFTTYSYDDIVNCHEDVPELEALMRWTMVLYNQHPWHRQHTRLTPISKVCDDDVVMVLYPRNHEVLQFIQRVKSGRRPPSPRPIPVPKLPASTCPAVHVRNHFSVQPRIESLAAVKGEIQCTNEDLVRNAAYNWSPMSAREITEKTGIECRLYTQRSLEDISLEAIRRALDHAGRTPDEIGAVICCTCTSNRQLPSLASSLSGLLGIYQTYASFDLVAACAGMVYGLAECVRLIQEIKRPVVLVCAEKFSDKVGTVRPSRMVFSDGAAALVLGPAPDGAPSDIEMIQTYASGPFAQVNSIIGPNPEFDNGITVYGAEVRALVRRYLKQMMEELSALCDPNDASRSLLDTLDLIVPHQANRTMVTELARAAGIAPDKLYFNIDKVGNTSAASIPIAVSDATREGVIRRTARVFAPGFGAGAVAGYAIMRIDPRIVALEEGPVLRAESYAAEGVPAENEPITRIAANMDRCRSGEAQI